MGFGFRLFCGIGGDDAVSVGLRARCSPLYCRALLECQGTSPTAARDDAGDGLEVSNASRRVVEWSRVGCMECGFMEEHGAWN